MMMHTRGQGTEKARRMFVGTHNALAEKPHAQTQRGTFSHSAEKHRLVALGKSKSQKGSIRVRVPWQKGDIFLPLF